MRVNVQHTIGGLASDLASIPPKGVRKFSATVRKNVREGREQAKVFAREKAGPHGTNYYKRITSEMLGPLEGEFGPHGEVAGNAVGGGWRNGPPNTDLARAADIIGSQFADDIGDDLDTLFWP